MIFQSAYASLLVLLGISGLPTQGWLGGREAPAPQRETIPLAYEMPCATTPETFLQDTQSARTPDGSFRDGTCFLLMPGDYKLDPAAYVDSTCGNCESPDTPVEATVGLVVSGVGVVIEGSSEDPGDVVIHTDAGYGILFEDCENCVLRGVTVTGGSRDPDGRATDAGVVVRRGSVKIENCIIRDNVGDPDLVRETVVGIIGIAGREGASIEVRGNQITRNSWDGIALYRGARASITNNVIDGIDKAKGETIGGGRGVGIGVTWDAVAHVEHNLVRRYWKGIGIFVDAECHVIENVVEEILTWGIAFWDAGRGAPFVRMERNLVYDTGACGISISSRAEGNMPYGWCRENVVVLTGSDPKYDDPEAYCAQCPIAVEARPEGFVIEGNVLYQNRRAGCGDPLDDLSEEEFQGRASALLERLFLYQATGAAKALAELSFE